MPQRDTLATSAAPARTTSDSLALVRVWLFTVAALIFAVVMIGGATRLTESGLSITEWQPITGVIPPLGEQAWLAEFDRYKQIPQYAAFNQDMTLEGFKSIFFWEWTHRLFARLIGLTFIAPGLWFWRRGLLKGALGRQVLVATGLLALEPIVGWWMVSSGLANRTEVAQERLAIHLLIAAATFAALIYAGVGLAVRPRESANVKFVAASAGLVALVFCQLGLGALMAGLRGGYIDNTWPLMDGALIPNGVFALTPWPRSIIDDMTTSQFDHRLGAYAVFVATIAFAVMAFRRAPGSSLARRGLALALLAVLQVGLGIATLVLVMPIEMALAHQAVALLLFGMAVANWRVTAMEWAQGRAASALRAGPAVFVPFTRRAP
ncbi:MAG: COX15/CtaA family protein [Hyphomicrobiales bacterium]|nr:COX15/CtaA family protein [Hyphomicrobiales bacterium]MBV8662264.1 COX15/CtaA family protein [Hyphomicrobiales bacterium]